MGMAMGMAMAMKMAMVRTPPHRLPPHRLPDHWLPPAAVTGGSSLVVYLSNQLRRYSCERMKFDGFELVPCHSSLNRSMAVVIFLTFSAM